MLKLKKIKSSHREIASMTQFSNHQVDVKNTSLGGDVSGDIVPNGDAFIAFKVSFI